MMKLTKLRTRILFLTLAAAALLCTGADAQKPTSGSATKPWGAYNWQVDQGTKTTTITAEATFNTPPGLVQITVPIPGPMTVHEVHGNCSLAVPQGGSKGNGSILEEVRDQSGNALVAVKLEQFGPSTTNVPITGTFPNGLPVTSLQLQFFVDEPGTQIVTVSLVMS